MMNSVASSAKSFQTRVSTTGTELHLGCTPAFRDIKNPEMLRAVAFGDIQWDKHKSVGSRAHGLGSCKPCIMQHWALRSDSGTTPCNFGVLCPRCHELHT